MHQQVDYITYLGVYLRKVVILRYLFEIYFHIQIAKLMSVKI